MALSFPGLSLSIVLLCFVTSWTVGGAQSCDEESCVNGNCDSSGICQCDVNWYGSTCSEFICEPQHNPCLNDGICIPHNETGDFTCDCPDNYGGPLCLYFQGPGAVVLCNSTDLDCGAYGTCVMESGVETCLCDAGYGGINCQVEQDSCLTRGCKNGGTCIPNTEFFLECECLFGYNSAAQCSIPDEQFRLCDVGPYPCENGGTCTYPVPIPAEGLPYVCECAPEFTGVNCTTRICDELQCLNGGVCEIDHCNCALGWEGDNCSIFNDPCVEVVCENGGSCDFDTNSTFCVCPSNFTGDDCCQDVDECAAGSTDVCENGGECVNTFGGFLCSCPAGYEGPTCGDLIQHCNSDPCQNGGVCENTLDGYVCKCSSAHVGLHCEILREDTCVSEKNQCYFGGECVEDLLLNRHVCNCSEGYTGEFCLYQYQPCKEMQCNTSGTLECPFENGVPYCKCKAGFTGPYCETATVCTSFPCENGGTCYADDDGGYSCDCSPGYTGGKCQTLIYSECAGDGGEYPGCVRGACFQLFGENFCKCDPGWGGQDCSTDLNECSWSPCQNGGTCINRPGGYICTCAPGYSGEDCSGLDGSCDPSPCQNGGTCVPGTPLTCSCQPGYTGPFCEMDDCNSDQCDDLANDGECNIECFTAGCGFDGGRDCFTPSGGNPWIMCYDMEYCSKRYNNGYCNQECNNGRCLYDGNDCLPMTKQCSDDMIANCTQSSGNGVCDKQCDSAECYTYDEDCVGHNQLYLPTYLVMILASVEITTFDDGTDQDFLADLGDIIHAIVKLIDVLQLSQNEVDRLDIVSYNSRYKYWRVTMEINIQYCEAACPTSTNQALGSIQAAYSSGRTSIGGYEVIDAYEEEPPSTTSTQTIVFYSVAAVVCVVLVVVAVGVLGKRVRDNGGVKAVAKKIKVRSTWQVPGGATPEPGTSPLTRGQSLTSDGRSSSVEPILDPSGKKDGFPYCTLSRIEVPIHPGGASDASCVLGESGKDHRKWTLLHREAAHQPSDALKRIVTNGAARNGTVVDINSQGPGGFTPLMVAIVAEKGPWRIRSHSGHAVRSDSSSGSEHSEHDFLLNTSSHNSPHLAARRMPSKREMPESRIAALITMETDVNLVNDQGQTALHLAVLQGRGDYVQVLLATKADPNVQDMWGQSPLHVAIGAAAEGAFKVLLDHPKTNIELKSQGGITPLMMAVMMLNQNMMKALVQRNADIASTDSEGRTAVHWAAMLNNVEALKLLVRQGPDNVKDASNSKGETALFLACREGCVESVRHLLDCFANTTLLDNLERSPMQIAYEKQNRDIVDMLQQSSQGHMVPPPPYMKHIPSHSAANSMFGRMSSGVKMEPGLQATSMHPTIAYPSSQHQAMYHQPQESSVPLTFGDFAMGRQSSVERALDYLVETTLLSSQPPTDHSPSLRLTHPSDSPSYMATGSYADPSNQPQSSASMMHGNGVVQDVNHSSPSHPVISPGMQPGASMGVPYSQGLSTGSYDPVSTATGVYASPSEMESLTTFSPATVSAANQPITTHHTHNPSLDSVGSKPLQHLPYHGAYSAASTIPATSMNIISTSEGQYLPSMSSGHTAAVSSMEQSVQQSQGYDNANMHPSLSPLSAQTVSPNAQALHMPQAQHPGFSPNTAPPLSAGENKSPYSYGFPSPPKGPDDYSYNGASYQAVVGDVNSLTPSPEDYSNCTATEHSPIRPQATIIHGHYAAQEQMYPAVQLYHNYSLQQQTRAQMQSAMNSTLKESTV